MSEEEIDNLSLDKIKSTHLEITDKINYKFLRQIEFIGYLFISMFIHISMLFIGKSLLIAESIKSKIMQKPIA